MKTKEMLCNEGWSIGSCNHCLIFQRLEKARDSTDYDEMLKCQKAIENIDQQLMAEKVRFWFEFIHIANIRLSLRRVTQLVLVECLQILTNEIVITTFIWIWR